MKIKKGDSIIVIAGKDRGKTGTVAKTFPKSDKVLVDDVNVVKKHQKGGRKGQSGQIIEKPTPIHVSNVALQDKKTNKAVRIGYKFEGEGDKMKKIRVARPSGEAI